MNNKQEIKRRMELFRKGIDMKIISRLIDFEKKKDMISDLEVLSEGAKVKLNYEQISSNSDYMRDKENCPDLHRQNYINFVESNKETIFTVEYDSTYLNGSKLFVSFLEDDRESKWMWYVGDLIIVKDVNQ